VGQVVAKVRVSNPPDKSKYLDLELLVDTGSTCTWINGGRLKSLGIEIMGERKFRTIENRIVEMKIGEAVVECLSRKATTIVVFAQEGDNEVFGYMRLKDLD
jgi:predicted aspartyl protease